MQAQATRTSGRVTIRDLWNGEVIPGIAARCRIESTDAPHTIATRTDARGGFDLPVGRWSIETSHDFALPPEAFDLDTDGLVIWADRRLRLTIEVVDARGHPIAGALATVWRHGSPIAPSTHTDDAGHARLNFDRGARMVQLAVFEPSYEPALLHLEPHAGATDSEPLRITLASCTSSWTLAVLDAVGQPLPGATVDARGTRAHSPTIRLGTTDAGGLLQVNGTWMLQDHFFLLGGASFPFRSGPPSQTEPTRRRLTAPRRVEGRILLGKPASPLRWSVQEPRQSQAGTGMLPQFFESTAGAEAIASSLPASWPVRIIARRNGTIVSDEVVTVASENWSLLATIRQPRTRQLTVRSTTSAIDRIEVPGSDRDVVFQGADSQPANEVRLDVACEARVSLHVHFPDGCSTMLFAPPGDEDASVTLSPPSLVDVAFRVRDRRGAAICDARLLASPAGGSPLEDCAAPGWKKMRASNSVTCSLDPTGAARVRLIPGRYRVQLAQLSQRTSLGQTWSPDGAETIEVTAASTDALELTFARPRRVDVQLQALAGTIAPTHWVLSDGVYHHEARGPHTTVWLTEDGADLRVLTASQSTLASAAIAPGTEPETIIMQLRD